MPWHRGLVGALFMALLGACTGHDAVGGTEAMTERPIIIAHRGASGERPEHTLAAYELAIELGADFIEPDLVLTKDGVLVARHENEISETTDIAERPEFADRRTTKRIDGQEITGWFTEDFTLAELKTLRAKERLPQLRPANTDFDGQFHVPTFEEILDLLQRYKVETGEVVGVYPETKHPTYFTSIGLPHEEPLLRLLSEYGYGSAADPVFIQSFEVGNLRALNEQTDIRLVQLMTDGGGPADRPDSDYATMLSDAGLQAVARYADAIGIAKTLVIPRDADQRSLDPTDLVARAHAVGLDVHVWTLRAENFFLPADMRDGDDPAGKGDIGAEVTAFAVAGVDGLFTDHSREAVAALAPE